MNLFSARARPGPAGGGWCRKRHTPVVRPRRTAPLWLGARPRTMTRLGAQPSCVHRSFSSRTLRTTRSGVWPRNWLLVACSPFVLTTTAQATRPEGTKIPVGFGPGSRASSAAAALARDLGAPSLVLVGMRAGALLAAVRPSGHRGHGLRGLGPSPFGTADGQGRARPASASFSRCLRPGRRGRATGLRAEPRDRTRPRAT